MNARLYLDVEFDENKTDAESVATALDRVLETGMSTPGVLDEYGDPTAGEFFVLDTEAARQRAAAPAERLAERAASAGLQPEDLDELVHELASGVAADVNNGGLEEQARYLVERLGAEHAERQLDELVEKRQKENE
jgi:hypothetical protein